MLLIDRHPGGSHEVRLCTHSSKLVKQDLFDIKVHFNYNNPCPCLILASPKKLLGEWYTTAKDFSGSVGRNKLSERQEPILIYVKLSPYFIRYKIEIKSVVCKDTADSSDQHLKVPGCGQASNRLRTTMLEPLKEALQHGVVQATVHSHLDSACFCLESFEKTQFISCLTPDSTRLCFGIYQSHPL